ncbi:uncharacterized protein LOC142357345 isoform X3 [Convolutriloba macropyga]|uniref:uncharacterized protein LOC142357345 isoform X3 n=1 Tax=Convolutriloba macropyga TaxID=536237 RepID=UPI003F52306C
MSSGNLLQAANNSYHAPPISRLSRGTSHNSLEKPSPPLTTFVGYSPKRLHRLHSPQMPRSHHHVRMSIDVGTSSPTHSGFSPAESRRPVSPLVTGGQSGSGGGGVGLGMNHDYAVPNMFQNNSIRDTLNNPMTSVNNTGKSQQPVNGTAVSVGNSSGSGSNNPSGSVPNPLHHSFHLNSSNSPLQSNSNSSPNQNNLRTHSFATSGGGSTPTGPGGGGALGGGQGGRGNSFKSKDDQKISSKLKKAIQEKVTGKSASDYMQDVDSDWCRFSDAILSRSAEAIRRLGPKIERDIDVAERLTAVIWENLRNPVSNPLVRQDNDDVCHPCKRQYLSMHTGRRCIHRIVKVYKLLAKCGISNQLLLYTAVEKQAFDVVKFLLQEASANVNGEYPTGSRMTPILYALDPSGIFGYIHAGQYKRRNLTYSKEDFMRVCIEEMTSEHDPHAELFEILVATGSNLNVRDPDGNCPVHRLGICKYESSKHVDTKILKIMLSCKHFDINARGAFGYTALHIYAMKNCEEEARLLVDRGADLDAQNDDGDTPLHIALKLAHIKIAMILIKSGCDVNRQGANGNTPLHYCVQRPDWHYVITELINNGAIINITNDKEEAPLHLAVKHPHVCMHLIDNGALVNKQRTDGSTVLHMFARAGNYECVKMMLDADADANLPTVDGEIPLHLAVDHPRILKLLLNYGCDVDKQGLGGNSTLHYCAVTGNITGIQALIQAGANVNIVNDTGDTPLHVATKYPDIVRALIEAQANANMLNCIDRLPLHCAAIELEHCENWAALVESIELLLDENSDVSVVDRSECTALHYITAFHHLGRSRCSDSTIHTRDFNYDLLRLVQKILETDAGIVNRKDSKGCTPVHIAVENGDLELTEVLLNHHGDPYVQNKYGQTCFDIAKTSHVKDVAPEIAVLLTSKDAMMKAAGNMSSFGQNMPDGAFGPMSASGMLSSGQVVPMLQSLLNTVDNDNDRDDLSEAINTIKCMIDKYGVKLTLSPEHKQTLKQVKSTLLEEMSPLYIIDALLNESVLNNIAAAEMKSAGSRRLQSERLLSFIFTNTDQIYDLFVYTLQQTNQSHLADIIIQNSTCTCHRITNSPSTELLSSSAENMHGGSSTNSANTPAATGTATGHLNSLIGVGMSGAQINGTCGLPGSQQHTYSSCSNPATVAAANARSRAPVPPPPPPPLMHHPSSRLGTSSPSTMGNATQLSIHNPGSSLLMRPASTSPPHALPES